MKKTISLFLVLLVINVCQTDNCFPSQVRLLIGEGYYSYAQQTLSNELKIDNIQQILSTDAPQVNNARLMFQTIDQCDHSYIQLNGTVNQKFSNLNLTVQNIEESQWNDTFCHNVKTNCEHVLYDQFVHDFEFYVDPEMKFSYSIFGDPNNLTQTTTGPFNSIMPPMQTHPNQSLEILFFGDMSLEYNGLQTLDYLQQLQQNNLTIDALLFLGDYAYEFYQNNGKKGDDMLQAMQDIDTYWPLAISAGNHQDNFNYTFYNQKFHFPLFKQTANQYYSFNVGSVHFIALNLHYYNNETGVYDTEAQTTMINWVKNDLINANLPNNRQNQPWIIVFGHQPIYCLNPSVCAVHYVDYQVFDELFHDYGVDLFLGAHDHSYQFLGPMYQNKSVTYSTNFTSDMIINPQATVHLIQGNAGCETMDPSPFFTKEKKDKKDQKDKKDKSLKNLQKNQDSSEIQEVFYPFKNEEFIRLNDQTFGNSPSFTNALGIGQLTIKDSNTLKIESFSSKDGSLIESFVLYVQNHGPFQKNLVQFVGAKIEVSSSFMNKISILILLILINLIF